MYEISYYIKHRWIYLIIPDDRRPLKRQSHILPFTFIEPGMNPMFEIARRGNQRLFLLLRKHASATHENVNTINRQN